MLSCPPVSSHREDYEHRLRVKTDKELSAEFRALTDKQLIETGKMLKDFAKPRPGQGPDENWLRQLKISREEWKRRYPRKDG
jgi:hypothetical protein